MSDKSLGKYPSSLVLDYAIESAIFRCVDAYEAIGEKEDGTIYSIGLYLTAMEANEAKMDYGLNRTPGRCRRIDAYLLTTLDKQFLIAHDSLHPVDNQAQKRALRLQAIAKLTEEEQAALGIR